MGQEHLSVAAVVVAVMPTAQAGPVAEVEEAQMVAPDDIMWNAIQAASGA